MPVDKFGRHLHQHSGDQSNVYLVEDASSLVATIKQDIITTVKTDISTLNYRTMFYVMALSTDNKGRYRLLNSTSNSEYIYNLPTGTIHDVGYIPPDSKIYINGVEKSRLSLKGLQLTTGDKISAMNKPDWRHVFACEFVMQIPILP